MSGKLKTLFIITILLTIGLIYVVIKASQKTEVEKPQSSLPEPQQTSTVPKTASLYFSKPVISTNTTTLQSVDIMLNSGNADVVGAQVELRYDPVVLKNMRIVTPDSSFFGSISDYIILFNKVDQDNGRISFAIAIKQNGSPKQGMGKVASLTFTPQVNARTPSTKISFAPTTLVTKLDARETVLKEAIGVSIVYATQNSSQL